MGTLVGPKMPTGRIPAHKIQGHGRVASPIMRLKVNRLRVAALWTGTPLRPRQRRIRTQPGHNSVLLQRLGENDITVYAVLVRLFLVVAVPASKQQHAVGHVLFRVEHVVALGAKANGRHVAPVGNGPRQ